MPKTYQNQEQNRRLEKVEEHLSVINGELSSVKIDMAQVKTDLCWLKKNYWVVVTASVGALIGVLINLVIK